jgi:hypothetical protein
MFLAIRGTNQNKMIFASVAALGIIIPASWADERWPEQVLREQGLVRAGLAYIFKEEADLRNRIVEIGRQLASWKEEQAGLEEWLETLSRLRLQHQEVMKKLRSLANGQRPSSKDSSRPPFHAPAARFRPLSAWIRATPTSAGWHGRLRSRPER